MYRIDKRFSVFVSLVLLGIVGVSTAQQAPQRWSALTVEVKPGANAQFEEFIKAFKAAVESTDSPMHWLTSQTEIGGSNNYVFHRPIASFAELETPVGAVLSKAYNEREVQRLLALYTASAASVRTAGYIDRPDLSRPGPAMPDVAAVEYIDLKVRSGMNAEFEDLARHVVEASAATTPNVHWEMRAPLLGADNTYRVVITFAKWADADAMPKPIPQRLAEHYGAAEAARLLAQGDAAIESTKTSLRRTRGDLARPPATE